ncbi:hypothetical protein RN607_08175 [Demequina capsici]|uniref:Uncharacterized protein n=1 Tax=Demequina capsici TaxID=3075620 RepID=A0AA96J9A0_9MICO|nr:hypothetical protein [Demequina sp. PMTSA13]WNM26175.1 hypothetical protein RN607_08175 [Demequina sp. PMTSA13]
MTQVAILMDVDGVVLPYVTPGERLAHWPAATSRIAPVLRDIEIRWSDAMIERLAVLTDLPGVQPMWCTTWGSRAATLLGPIIGLGQDWPCLEGDGGGAFAEAGWWKADRAREAVAVHDAVVWVDDLIDGWRDEIADTGLPTPERWPGGRLLTVCPRPDRGLEPEHLDHIEEFVRGASRSPASPSPL